MIKGRGLMANVLRKIDDDKYLFYVNGISNSVIHEIPENNFEYDEIMQLAEDIEDRIFVYVSTTQVNVQENHSRPYVRHKFKMECLVKDSFSNYLVVRTSNLVGNNPWNTHTLFNFLYNALMAGREISVVESAMRNILDADHFTDLFDYYLKNEYHKNHIINIINPVTFNMAEILKAFEVVFNKSFLKNHVEDSIAYFDAPAGLSLLLLENCDINLDNYLSTVIKKYYVSVINTFNLQT